MPTQQESIDAFLQAVASGIDPQAIINYSNAVSGGIPPEVASNPSAYGYDYANDPTGQAYLRNEAFAPTQSYDYRTNPGYLAFQRGADFATSEADRVRAQNLGNLDVLQPVTESDIVANRDNALRGVDSNYESRGLYNSGLRAEDRARTTGDYERQLTGVQLSGQLQRGNIQSDYAAQLADIERRRADALAQYANPPAPGAPPGG